MVISSDSLTALAFPPPAPAPPPGPLPPAGVYPFLSWRVFSDLTFHTQGFKPAIVLPLVCLLFAYLAARAIFRDELLVRAADRIR